MTENCMKSLGEGTTNYCERGPSNYLSMPQAHASNRIRNVRVTLPYFPSLPFSTKICKEDSL